MTIAAPVAFSGAGKNAVSVGLSLSASPSAPGAPLGQSGIGSSGAACSSAARKRAAMVSRCIFRLAIGWRERDGRMAADRCHGWGSHFFRHDERGAVFAREQLVGVGVVDE